MTNDRKFDLTTAEGVRKRDEEMNLLRIPPAYRAATVTDARVGAWCEALSAAVLDDSRPKKPILIHGVTGVGKTWQAFGAIRYITARVRTDWLWTTAADLYANLRPRDGHDSEGEYRRWSSVPLLLLDDIGAAKDTAWTEEIDYRLVNHRSAYQLPTIFTTNLPPRAQRGPSLEAALGARVFSRLAECTEVRLEGKDKRRLTVVPGEGSAS